jgi:hypothetical protein
MIRGRNGGMTRAPPLPACIQFPVRKDNDCFLAGAAILQIKVRNRASAVSSFNCMIFGKR